MKYFITLILLLTILIIGQVIKTEFPLALNIVLIISLFTTPILWEYSIINKNYEADFKIRSQRKIFGKYELIFAIAWTLIFVFQRENYKNIIYLVLIVWTFPIVELFMWFVYKRKKSFTLFIKENEMILNRRWNPKRNLTELTQIQFDRFSKNLKLDFKSKSEISIKTTEYKTKDIEKLLEILIQKSENNVFIPRNYEQKIKNSC
jgi:hypothetical protein